MFIGHYGPAYAIKAIRTVIPLWLLFIAGQLEDVGWTILVLLRYKGNGVKLFLKEDKAEKKSTPLVPDSDR
jgi:hypothetical protein